MTLYISTHSKHTLGHIDCPACHELQMSFLSGLSPQLTFEAAADIYMRMREVDATPGAVRSARFIKDNTLHSYRDNITSLLLFYAGTLLCDIHPGTMRAYQIARLNGHPPFVRYRRPQDAKDRIVHGVLIPAKGKTPCKAKPEKIRQELGLLIRIMKRAGAWTKEHEQFFENLQTDEPEIPHALTPLEQAQWLEMAKMKERWCLVYWWSLVAFHTLCSPCELRGLRIGDVSMEYRKINVPWASSKNRFRCRSISITDPQCYWALEQILLRAHDLGSVNPTHYLFPFRDKRTGLFDPTRPMTVTGLKTKWDEVRQATGLTWFRIADTRHTGATREAERGVPPHIIKERMGHSNPRMQQHYTHIAESVQRRWLENPQEQFMRARQPQPGWYPPQQPQAIPSTGPRTIMFMGKQMVVPA